jgi:hypothetical protein
MADGLDISEATPATTTTIINTTLEAEADLAVWMISS